jgi:hypothetical protein
LTLYMAGCEKVNDRMIIVYCVAPSLQYVY